MRPPPGAYVSAERARQAAWRETTPDLPDAARGPGAFDGRSHAWLLPVAWAEHNLAASIRAPVLAHFARHDIAWHDGDTPGYGPRATPGPSPNLMDSQVACLNFWWGLAPDALLAIVRTFAPEATRLVPPDGGPLVEPEWIGRGNPLGERGQRQRGRYATSADAFVTWEDRAGHRHGALIESKYGESYDGRPCRFSSRGTDRAAIYRPAVAALSPFVSGLDVADLMFEPFDQHLRQQLLAAAIEAGGELRSVRLVHVAPRANRAFHEHVTALTLAGQTVADAWRAVLRQPDRYVSLAYEDLARADPGLWEASLTGRYGWAS